MCWVAWFLLIGTSVLSCEYHTEITELEQTLSVGTAVHLTASLEGPMLFGTPFAHHLLLIDNLYLSPTPVARVEAGQLWALSPGRATLWVIAHPYRGEQLFFPVHFEVREPAQRRWLREGHPISSDLVALVGEELTFEIQYLDASGEVLGVNRLPLPLPEGWVGYSDPDRYLVKYTPLASGRVPLPSSPYFIEAVERWDRVAIRGKSFSLLSRGRPIALGTPPLIRPLSPEHCEVGPLAKRDPKRSDLYWLRSVEEKGWPCDVEISVGLRTERITLP